MISYIIQVVTKNVKMRTAVYPHEEYLKCSLVPLGTRTDWVLLLEEV